MTIFIIWVIAFALILFFANKRWDSSVSRGLDKVLPDVLKTHGDNRPVWVGALAVLGATTLVRPVDVLLVVILLTIIGLVVAKLAGLAAGKSAQ